MNVRLLEMTGVGKTVNGARKFGGEVAEWSKRVVDKWKQMVAEETEREGR